MPHSPNADPRDTAGFSLQVGDGRDAAPSGLFLTGIAGLIGAIGFTVLSFLSATRHAPLPASDVAPAEAPAPRCCTPERGSPEDAVQPACDRLRELAVDFVGCPSAPA